MGFRIGRRSAQHSYPEPRASSGPAPPPVTNVGVITPEQFGAVGDGVTNDSVAMRNAFLALSSTILLAHTLLLGSGRNYFAPDFTYHTPDGCAVIGWSKSGSIVSTNANRPCIEAWGSTNVYFANFTMEGSGRPPNPAAPGDLSGSIQTLLSLGQDGAAGSGANDALVVNMTFDGAADRGLSYCNANLGNQRGPIVEGCLFVNCDRGTATTERGEYIQYIACAAKQNNYGEWVDSGNVTSEMKSDENWCNLFLSDGANSGHGSFAGSLNHGTVYALYDNGSANGFTICSGHVLWLGSPFCFKRCAVRTWNTARSN